MKNIKFEFIKALSSAPNYSEILKQNKNHRLISVSNELTSVKFSDVEHNQKLLDEKLITDIASRAANVIDDNKIKLMD